MYKALCVIALLAATFALTSGSKPADASASGLPSPVIVARGSLLNQTAPIPKTTIFTPTQTGVYRVSPYLALTSAASSNPGFWYFDFYWTDEGGARSVSQMLALDGQGFAGNSTDGVTVGSFTFRAVAGQSVEYDITECCPTAGGTYELFFTIERLE